MIDYQLKPCCNDCDHIEFRSKQYTCEWYDNYVEKVEIWCDHQEVCGKYNEVKYHSEVE